ncbi:MAG: hypothetical protein VKO00_03495 [Cyanobacteriota bacterium]|nr:hypothetical protein [Cyanobacteriota bacterium]
MTTFFLSELPPLTLNSLLALTASLLLIFVSGGVLYLSTMEWRDRRRRQAIPQGASRRSR